MKTTNWSRERLIELAQKWYPRISAGPAELDDLPEWLRLKEQCRSSWEHRDAWDRLIATWEAMFPGCASWDYTLPVLQPCYFFRLYVPGPPQPPSTNPTLVALVSYLAPVYMIYVSYEAHHGKLPTSCLDFHPTGRELGYAETMAAEIESVFGYEALPYDLGSLAVPDVMTERRRNNDATLMDCLFTDDLW